VSSLDRTDPETWTRIGDDPTLKHLAENPNYYDGNVHEDLALMRSLGLLLVRDLPSVRLHLHFEDDGTMHTDVIAPEHKPADVGVVHGRYSVFLDSGSPDEHDVPADSAVDVVRAIAAISEDPERTRLLREKLATGSLDRARLRLAAYVGSTEAQSVLGAEAPGPFAIPDFDKVEWVSECAADFPSFGIEACARVAVAVGRTALAFLTRHGLEPDRQERKLFAAAVAFARCPCEAHQREAEALAASDDTTDLIRSALAGEDEEAVHAVVAAASVAGAVSAEAAADDLGRLIAYRPQSLIAVLRSEVMPWALGDRDPLASAPE
jgi:hypothetical protein